jgi:hypothetical protein
MNSELSEQNFEICTQHKQSYFQAGQSNFDKLYSPNSETWKKLQELLEFDVLLYDGT